MDLTPQQAGGYGGFRLTQERCQRIIELVQVGNYVTTAAIAAGLSERSISRYLARGRTVEETVVAKLGEDHELTEATENPWPNEIHDNDWTCWQLWHALVKAEAEAEAFAVATVRKHMADNWTAAMTYLERKNPKRWRRRDLHEVAMQDAAERQEDDDAGLLGEGATEHIHAALREAAKQLPPGE